MSAAVALLRIARRDAARARGRSALICAMVALPVFALAFADVLARTAEPDPDERIARTLGAAQYRLSAEAGRGAHVSQAPDPDRDGWISEGGSGSAAPDLATLAPAGARTGVEAIAGATIRTAGGVASVGWTEVAAADPLFHGRYRLVAGRAPRRSGEVLVSPDLLEHAGIDVGAPLTVTSPRRTVTVVGTAREEGIRGNEQVYAPPGTLIGRPGGIDAGSAMHRLYVAGVDGLSWAAVRRLNDRGVVVYDRGVVAQPPERAQVPYFADDGGDGVGDERLFALLAGGVLLALATLEVVLLAGAAFAVGARRQAHALALLAATGASARHVRLVVLAGGAVLGAVAGVAGVAAGVLAAALAREPLGALTGTAFARFDVRPLELLPVGSVAVVTGVLAAVLPARAAARQDVVAALAGRRGTVRGGRRTPVAAVLLTAAGAGAAALGSLWTATQHADGEIGDGTARLVTGVIAGGAVLTVLGLVVLSPSLMGAAARLGGRLPLAARLVVRDAGRHRARSAPAMSAVLAAVAGSAALLLVVAATDAHDRRMYVASLPAGTAAVSLVDYSAPPPADGRDKGPRRKEAAAPDGAVVRPAAPVLAAARRELPVRDAVVVEQPAPCDDATCPRVQYAVPPAHACPPTVAPGSAAAERDWRCADISDRPARLYDRLGDSVVGDADALARLFGVRDPAAARALAAGGVVAFDRRLVSGGRVNAELVRDRPDGTTAVERRAALPAVHVAGGAAPGVGVLLSPRAARRLGLHPVPAIALLQLTRLPTEREEDAFNAALAATGSTSQLTVERGYRSDFTVGLVGLMLAAAVITLGAAGISTGLAQADARADHATLAAVGADPRLRRRVSGLQALLIAGLGTALGVAVGFVPGAALIGADASLELTIPWAPLLVLLLAVPAVAAAGAWLCTPARLALDRRLRA